MMMWCLREARREACGKARARQPGQGGAEGLHEPRGLLQRAAQVGRQRGAALAVQQAVRDRLGLRALRGRDLHACVEGFGLGLW